MKYLSQRPDILAAYHTVIRNLCIRAKRVRWRLKQPVCSIEVSNSLHHELARINTALALLKQRAGRRTLDKELEDA